MKAKKLWRWTRSYGITGTVKRLIDYGLYRLEQSQDYRFDRKYGISTAGKVRPEELNANKDIDPFNKGYEPVTSRAFGRIMRAFPAKPDDYVFIDLGSGLGRALFLAVDYKFREYLGIEYVPELHDRAERNLKAFESKTGKPSGIKLVCKDASTFEWPVENTVLFMYSPFFGEVLDAVLFNIELSVKNNPRPFWILYRNPEQEDQFENRPLFRKITSAKGFFDLSCGPEPEFRHMTKLPLCVDTYRSQFTICASLIQVTGKKQRQEDQIL